MGRSARLSLCSMFVCSYCLGVGFLSAIVAPLRFGIDGISGPLLPVWILGGS